MWGSRKFLLKVEDLAKERRSVWKVFEPRHQGPGSTRARVVQTVILNVWPEKREAGGPMGMVRSIQGQAKADK